MRKTLWDDMKSLYLSQEDHNETVTEYVFVCMCMCVQYSYYGTSVVKACIEAGTHHIDICGEPGVSSCHCKPTIMCGG